jgi:hypothetical protein
MNKRTRHDYDQEQNYQIDTENKDEHKKKWD